MPAGKKPSGGGGVRGYREVPLALPLRGYDSDHSYAEQPPKTTPAAINVRAYSYDEERARIGSRPGLAPAYQQQVGGGAPVRGLWWLDYGYGDTVAFDEDFGSYPTALLNGETEYPNIPNTNQFTFNTGSPSTANFIQVGDTITVTGKTGQVTAVTDNGTTGSLTVQMADSLIAHQFTNGDSITDTTHSKTATINGTVLVTNPLTWPDASQYLQAANGAVYPHNGTVPYSNLTSGEYKGFNGDTWQDFKISCGVQWNPYTSGSLFLWSSSATGAATDGITCRLDVTITAKPSPDLGFSELLTITLVANGGTKTVTKVWNQFEPNLVEVTGGQIRVEANMQTVQVFWDGGQVISIPRPAGAAMTTPCSCGGFKLSIARPGGTLPANWDDSLLLFKILNWNMIATTRPITPGRKLVTIANRNVYAESSEGTMGSSPVDTDTLADVPLYSAAHCNGCLYILDGGNPIYYSPAATSNHIRQWSARSGLLDPTARLVANYRNRLVVAGTFNDPQNWYMSRQDDPFDFQYGQNDAQSAVAGNEYSGGRVSDPITALCPGSDNMLLIGTTRSIWAVHGDPAAGGMVTSITQDCGILSQTAWCADPLGFIYFLSPQGLFHVVPLRRSGGGHGIMRAQDITSTRIPGLGNVSAVQPGQAASAGDYYVNLCFDEKAHGIQIWLTPYSTGTARHFFFDLRTQSFWPEAYPSSIGPVSAAFYNAKTPTYRAMVLGGTNGLLYRFSDSTAYDVTALVGTGGTAGGTAGFTSSFMAGSYQLIGDVRDCVMTGFKPVLSQGSTGARYALYAAHTAEGCVKSAAKETGLIHAGENPRRPRLIGCSHAVQIYALPADKLQWAMEGMVAEITPSGRCRG